MVQEAVTLWAMLRHLGYSTTDESAAEDAIVMSLYVASEDGEYMTRANAFSCL